MSAASSSPPQGILYVCATPIGNLADVSFRLIETLKKADVVAAEDTRVSGILLERYDIRKPLLSLQKFNEQERIATILSHLENGRHVAVVSDAGTPAVSDPGTQLVRTVYERGMGVVPVPGPSAVTTLMSVSGMPADRFCFLGFFPRKEKDALDILSTHRPLFCPLVFFESPKRLVETMSWISSHFPGSLVTLGKELTKHHETLLHGSVEAVCKKLEDIPVKGEWCVAVLLPQAEETLSTDDTVRGLKEQGLSLKQIIYVTTQLLGLSKNKVYESFHQV